MDGRAYRRKQQKKQFRQRFFATVFAVALVCGVVYSVNLPIMISVLAETPAQTEQIAPAEQASPQVQAQTQPKELPMRDPFAAPPEFRPKQDNGNSGVGAIPTQAKRVVPILNGIVAAGNVKSAIIQYGVDSRSYRINDYVGPYQIAAINQNSVTLRGPNGTVVLGIGR